MWLVMVMMLHRDGGDLHEEVSIAKPTAGMPAGRPLQGPY
jgi:hypothetical protein